MKYELSHDTIALQVYQKASTEARTRRRLERYVGERYTAFEERQVALTQDDVNYIWPYLEVINISEKEMTFLELEQKKLVRSRKIRRLILLLITSIFALLAILAIRQSRVAQANEKKTQVLNAAISAQLAYKEGLLGTAFRLAEEVLNHNTNKRANGIAEEVINKVQASPLVSTLQHTDSISVLQFSLDGTFYLSASMDGETRLSKLNKEILFSVKHDTAVLWASLLDNDQRLAVQTAANIFYVYDLTSGNKQSFSAGGEVKAVSILRNQVLLAAAIDKNITVWNIVADEVKVKLKKATTEPLRALQLVAQPEGWELISADHAGNAYRWNQDGEKLTTYPNILSTTITGISVDVKTEKVVFRTPVGDFLTTYTGDTLQTTNNKVLLFRAFQPNTSAFSGSNTINRLVGLSPDSSVVYVFNFGSKDSDIDMQHRPKTTARCGILSPNGKIFLSGSADNETVVFGLRDELWGSNQTLFHFDNRIDWGKFAPNNAHFLSSASGNKALLWKFDQLYVDNKKGIAQKELISYYQRRLDPLTPQERLFYQLD